MTGYEITAIDPSYPHRSDRYPSSQIPKLRAPDTGTFRGYLSLKSSLKLEEECTPAGVRFPSREARHIAVQAKYIALSKTV